MSFEVAPGEPLTSVFAPESDKTLALRRCVLSRERSDAFPDDDAAFHTAVEAHGWSDDGGLTVEAPGGVAFCVAGASKVRAPVRLRWNELDADIPRGVVPSAPRSSSTGRRRPPPPLKACVSPARPSTREVAQVPLHVGLALPVARRPRALRALDAGPEVADGAARFWAVRLAGRFTAGRSFRQRAGVVASRRVTWRAVVVASSRVGACSGGEQHGVAQLSACNKRYATKGSKLLPLVLSREGRHRTRKNNH